MVDPISATPLPATPGVASVARAAPTPAPVPVAKPTEPGQPQLAMLARSVAASAPVDKERVAQIKAAIANGTFPILPATVADRLLALRYEWMGDDQT